MSKHDVEKLDKAIMDILEEYGDVVFKATNEALGAGEKILIKKLKSASPIDTGVYKKTWKGTGKKYKMVRFVGNTTAKITKGKEVPLSNVLEYSTEHGKPFIKKTYESSVNEIANAIINEVKKGV